MAEAFFAFWYFIFAVMFAWSSLLTQDITSRSQMLETVVGMYKKAPFTRDPARYFEDIQTPAHLWTWLMRAFLPVTFAETPSNGKRYGYCTTGHPCYINQGGCSDDNQCYSTSTCADKTPLGQGVMVHGEYWDAYELEEWCEYLGTPVNLSMPSGATQPCNPVASAIDNAFIYLPDGKSVPVQQGPVQGPCCWNPRTEAYITSIEAVSAGEVVSRLNCPSYLPFNIECCEVGNDEPLTKNETAMSANLMQSFRNLPAQVGSFNRVVFARMTMRRYKRSRREGLFTSDISHAIAGGDATALVYDAENSDDIEDKRSFTIDGVTYDWNKETSYKQVGGFSVMLPGPYQSDVWEAFVHNLGVHGWFDQRMASFALDMLFYNGNKDAFMYMTLIAEFDFTGTATVHVNPRIMNFHANQWEGEYLLPRTVEVILTVLVILLILVEFIRIYDTSLKAYFMTPIRIFDIISLVLCVTVLTINYCVLYTEKYSRFSFKDWYAMNPTERRKELDVVVELMSVVAVQQFLVAFNLFMIFIRGVKLVTALDGKLGLIVKAVEHVFSQLTWFCIIFLTLVSGFVGYAFVTFGNMPDISGMSDLLQTFYVIFTMLVGSSNIEALTIANKESAPFFFIVFYSVLLFIMINMFVSILLNGYDQAEYDLRNEKNAEVNVITKFFSELKTEVAQKCLYQTFYCLQSVYRHCIKPCLYGFFHWTFRPIKENSKYAKGGAVAFISNLQRMYRSWGSIKGTDREFKDSIRKARKQLKQAQKSYEAFEKADNVDGQKTFEPVMQELRAALSNAEEKRDELKAVNQNLEQKKNLGASVAVGASSSIRSETKVFQAHSSITSTTLYHGELHMSIEDFLEQCETSIKACNEARVNMEFCIKQYRASRPLDVLMILLFWCTFLTMMILMNRAEVAFSLGKATSTEVLSATWTSEELPMRDMDFYKIRTYADVGSWAKAALRKLYEVPICNIVSSTQHAIDNLTVSSSENVQFLYNCSVSLCGSGPHAIVKWGVSYGQDFEVNSVIEPVQLASSPLYFVMWAGTTKHMISIYGNEAPSNYTYGREGDQRYFQGLSFIGAGQLSVGVQHTVTVKRTDYYITVSLDGKTTSDGRLVVYDHITHVGWQPKQNAIKVRGLSSKNEAGWRWITPGREVECDSTLPEVSLLQTTKSWNVGFLNTTLVRVTVQPACYHNNTEPRWKDAAAYLRRTAETYPCANSACFVDSVKDAKDKGSSCYNSEGELIDSGIGVMKKALDSTAPYQADRTGQLGPYRKLGGLVFNLGSELNECLEKLESIDVDGWFSKNSASIAFDWITYNGNYDVFTYNGITFSLLPTGMLDVNHRNFVISLNVVEGGQWYMNSRITVLVLFTIYGVAVVVYLFALVDNLLTERRFCLSKQRFGLSFLQSYYSSLWNIGDTFSLILSAVFIAFFIEYLTVPFRKEYKFSTSTHDKYPIPRVDEVALNMVRKRDPYRSIQDDWYAFSQIEGLVGKYYFLLNTAALNSFFMSLRVLRNVNRRPEFAVFAATLGAGAAMNIYFFIVIGCVFVGWALFFTVLFGVAEVRLSSVWWSLGTLFEWMLGSFDNKKMLEYSPVLTVCTFVCFQIIMKFIAINMFLATMLNTYSDTVGSLEVHRFKAQVDRERLEVFKEITYKTKDDFENEITIERDDHGVVKVAWLNDGSAAKQGLKVGHMLYSINGEKDEWKLLANVREIVDESMHPAGRDNLIHLTFKDVGTAKKTSCMAGMKRALKIFGDEAEKDAGGPRPTVKNFWRRHGAVTTVSTDALRLETKERESSEGENVDDDEDDELSKENTGLDDKTARGRIKKRLEGLLFSRAVHLSGGSDPYDIAHDGLIGQEFATADDGKLYQDCELDELRTRIESEPVTGWEVWLDCLITQIEREPEMDSDSIFTEVLRTAEMRELRKGTTDSSNVLREFWMNASDILSILEHKAKKRYYTELQHESHDRKKVLQEQNRCLHDYACSLEAEFEGLMRSVSTVKEKRDQLKQRLHELIGHDKPRTGPDFQRTPRVSPRFRQAAQTRPETNFEDESWNYSTGRDRPWNWATGRWPGHEPGGEENRDQTHV